MKLCRFELRASPGQVRSGIVHSGKVYETDGANPVAVHDAADVQPLTPVGRPPALRIFRNPDRIGERLDLDESELLPYVYGNPGSVIGSSHSFESPAVAPSLTFEPYLAAVVAFPARRVPVEAADDLLLGLTILNLFVQPGLDSARSYDFATILGPVLTTSDELEDYVSDQEFGRRYRLSVVTRVNGVERSRANSEELPITFAQALAACSQAVPVQQGDIIALGPLPAWPSGDPYIEPGDEIQVAVENLGTLATKVEHEISAR